MPQSETQIDPRWFEAACANLQSYSSQSGCAVRQLTAAALLPWGAFRLGMVADEASRRFGYVPRLMRGRSTSPLTTDHLLERSLSDAVPGDAGVQLVLFVCSRPQYVRTLAGAARALAARGALCRLWPTSEIALAAAKRSQALVISDTDASPVQELPAMTDATLFYTSCLTAFQRVYQDLLCSLRRLQPSAVVVARAWRPVERLLLRAACALGIPRIIVNHGEYPRSLAHGGILVGDVDVEMILVWNELQRRALSAFARHDRVRVTGLCAWSALAHSLRCSEAQPQRKGRPVVLWAVQPPHVALDGDAVGALSQSTGYRVVARAHPGHQGWGGLAGVEFQDPLEVSEIDAISEADIVVGRDSALLTLASLSGKPVLQFNWWENALDAMFSTPNYNERLGRITVDDPGALHSCIEQGLELQRIDDALVTEIDAGCAGDSAEQCADAIESVVNQ